LCLLYPENGQYRVSSDFYAVLNNAVSGLEMLQTGPGVQPGETPLFQAVRLLEIAVTLFKNDPQAAPMRDKSIRPDWRFI